MSSVIKIDIPALVRATVIKKLAPDDVVDLVQTYAHGKCAYFALALAEMSSLEELCAFANPEGIAKHFAVIANDQLYDAYGVTSVADVRDRYRQPELKGLRVPLEHVRDQLKQTWPVERPAAVAAVKRLAQYHKWKTQGGSS